MTDEADKDLTEPVENNGITGGVTGRGFTRGISGNPGGRPRAEREVRELARRYTAPAIRRLAQLMRSPNDRVAVAACSALLDRAWGKPAQALTGADGAPLIPSHLLVGLMGAAPISDALRAAQVYAEIIGNPGMDLEHVRFDPPASPLEEPATEQPATPITEPAPWDEPPADESALSPVEGIPP